MEVLFCVLKSGHLQVEIGQKEWRFTLCQSDKTWSGNLSGEEIEAGAQELDESVDEYSETAKNLFSNPASSKDIVIEFKDNLENGCAELSWKKITSPTVKYSLGAVQLEECSFEKIRDVLKNSFSVNEHLRAQLNVKISEKEKLKVDNERLAKHLVDFAEKKVELEGELFTKFALILTEKKSKIRALKAEIEALKGSESIIHVAEAEEPVNTSSAYSPGPSPDRNGRKKTKAAKIKFDDDDTEDLIYKIPKREKRSNIAYGSDVPSTSELRNAKSDEDRGSKMDVSVDKSDVDETMDASGLLEDL